MSSASAPISTLNRWQLLQQRIIAGWRRFRAGWEVFRQNRLAMFGLSVIFLFALMVIALPLLLAYVWAPRIYDPTIGYDFQIFIHPSPPSWQHLLGTDWLGHDVLSLLMAAAGPSFIVGLTAAVVTAIAGTLIGAFSAYFGGRWLDNAFTHLSNAMLLLPAPIMMIIVGSAYNEITPFQFGLVYGLIAGPSTAAVVFRSYGLSVMHKPFIAAARVSGGGAGHIIFNHLIPHMLPLASLYMMLTVVGAVVSDGFISFFGFTRPHANWGAMIYNAFTFSERMGIPPQWNVLLPPAIALSLFASAFYFVALGLQEVGDPRLRER
jgi:peptide/nickel transport system permease protein